MTILRTPFIAALLVTLCSIGTVSVARAQTAPSDADVAAARSLAEAGSVDYKNGDFAAALTKLERAYGVVKVPKLGLWYARSLAKNGKLVEAAERYAEVKRLEAKGPKAADQKQAQVEAEAEREQLLPRIPQLTITVEGAPAQAVQVTIDDVAMANSLIGEARPINPGKHLIQAKHGESTAKQELTIAEGERLPLVLHLSPAATTTAAAALPNPEPLRAQATPPVQESPPATSKPMQELNKHWAMQRTAGWVAVGVGGVGLVVGTVTGILVLSKKSKLEDTGDCPDNKCTIGTQHDAVTSYNSLRPVSTVGFVIGAIGGAAGVTLLLTAPKTQTEPRITAWLGPASAGVRGRF